MIKKGEVFGLALHSSLPLAHAPAYRQAGSPSRGEGEIGDYFLLTSSKSASTTSSWPLGRGPS